MGQQGVHSCWDLAVNLGFDGNDHTKIFNAAKGMPCAQSNPKVEDTMTYPCFQTALISLSSETKMSESSEQHHPGAKEIHVDTLEDIPEATAGISFLEKTEITHLHKRTNKSETATKEAPSHSGHSLVDKLKQEFHRYFDHHTDQEKEQGGISLVEVSSKKTAMEQWRDQIQAQERLNQEQMLKNAQHQNQQQEAQTQAAAALELEQYNQANYAANLQNNNGAVLEGLSSSSWGQQNAGVFLHKKHKKHHSDVLLPVTPDPALVQQSLRVKDDMSEAHQHESALDNAIMKAAIKGQLDHKTSTDLLENIGNTYGKSYSELLEEEQALQKKQVLKAEEQVAAQAAELNAEAKEHEREALMTQQAQQNAVAQAGVELYQQAREASE
jgi:hypothetical protein